jgi:hypothetical protein
MAIKQEWIKSYRKKKTIDISGNLRKARIESEDKGESDGGSGSSAS